MIDESTVLRSIDGIDAEIKNHEKTIDSMRKAVDPEVLSYNYPCDWITFYSRGINLVNDIKKLKNIRHDLEVVLERIRITKDPQRAQPGYQIS